MSEHPDPAEVPPAASDGRRRLWGVVTAVVVVGFVAIVVTSMRRAAVPVSAGDMGDMSIDGSGSGERMRMTMRDIGGRTVRFPDGRPGVAVLVDAANCAACPADIRAAARAVRAASAKVGLLVVNVDSATTRGDVTRLARGARSSDALYVVDDRNGSLAAMLDASAPGSTAVYDARGRIVAHPTTEAHLRTELERVTD